MRSPALLRLALIALAASIALLLAAACNGNGGGGKLTGTAWTLTTIDGNGALPDATPWLRFDDDTKVTGHTGCNSFGGKWKASGSDLTFDELVSTLIGCPGPVGDRESAFTTALRDTRSYTLEGGVLTLRTAGGDDRLAFRSRTDADATATP
jgi:heat shock protein HslJ